MWDRLRPPGRLTLLSGRGLHLFFQELAFEALHAGPPRGHVLWCDGGHRFNPYDQAELQLTRGFEADFGADRLLVKRCMTPFQWDTVLTRHLDQKLAEVEAGLVVVDPFDALWSHEEIQDWEQEDYTRFSLKHLAATARRFRVPILIGVDMVRWWKTHPVLAEATRDGVDEKWTIDFVGGRTGRWRAVGADGDVVDPMLRRSVTLLDFLEDVKLESPLVVAES